LTVPLPLPLPPLVIVNQLAELDAVHEHPVPAVTPTDPVVDAVVTERVVGETA
jgi:hypothetical protein